MASDIYGLSRIAAACDAVAWTKSMAAIQNNLRQKMVDSILGTVDDPVLLPSRLYDGTCKIMRHPDSNKITTPETWEVYKGFRLGFTGHTVNPTTAREFVRPRKNYFLACWLRPWDDLWEQCSIAVDAIEEVTALAQQCIDYLLVVRAMERTIGRRLESHELPKPEDLRELQKEKIPPEPATA